MIVVTSVWPICPKCVTSCRWYSWVSECVVASVCPMSMTCIASVECSTDHAVDIGRAGGEVHVSALSLLTAAAVHQRDVVEMVGHARGHLKQAQHVRNAWFTTSRASKRSFTS